ncbi:MAG: hypothetical protein ACK50A_03290 [Sphingobacteriaceae bacterium]
MEIDKIEEEIYENGNRKINIGVRAYSELKLKLSDEAKGLGISLSEHCENILITHAGLLEEVNELTKALEVLKQNNASLESSLAEVDLVSFNKKIHLLTDENVLLRNSIAELRSNQLIYSDPRLAYLFNKVKGKSDSIITDKGEMNITFNNPKDVLLALIYSYNL